MRTIQSSLQQDEVLKRLADSGRDWRESKLPDSVRRRWIFECTVAVTGRTFVLRLRGRPARKNIEWYGEVCAGDAAGSTVQLDWQLTRLGWIFCGLTAVAFAWGLFVDPFGAPLSWGVFLAIGIGGSLAWEVGFQGPMCDAILDHVVGTHSKPVSPRALNGQGHR